MKKTLKYIYFVVGLLIFTLVFAGGFYISHKRHLPKDEQISYAKDKVEIENHNKAAVEKILTPASDDVTYGKSDAKVVLISYDAFSCHHCASFYERVFPDFVEKYIKTGKVLFVHRNFPIDSSSLLATKAFECFAGFNKQNSELIFKLASAIFETQANWAFRDSGHDELYKSFQALNFSREKFDSCISDKTLEDKILEKRIQASNILGINATPKFFINGKSHDKGYFHDELFAAIDAAILEK